LSTLHTNVQLGRFYRVAEPVVANALERSRSFREAATSEQYDREHFSTVRVWSGIASCAHPIQLHWKNARPFDNREKYANQSLLMERQGNSPFEIQRIRRNVEYAT
jgi:hypothetical protein